MIREKCGEARGVRVPRRRCGYSSATAVGMPPTEVSSVHCQNALPSAHQNARCAGLAGS